MGTTKTLLSFAEFEQLPDRPGKSELLKGELIELPPAEKRHNLIATHLFMLLHSALDEAHARGEALSLGMVCTEMGYLLSREDGYVQPDVSVTWAAQPGDKYFEGAPAIAIEVISPSNSAESLDTKSQLYFARGAAEVWRVYPKTRHIDVHTAGGARVFGAQDAVTTTLIPGLSLRVSDVLAE